MTQNNKIKRDIFFSKFMLRACPVERDMFLVCQKFTERGTMAPSGNCDFMTVINQAFFCEVLRHFDLFRRRLEIN